LSYIFRSELQHQKDLQDKEISNTSSGDIASRKGKETLISLEMSLNVIHAVEEAIQRCILLSYKADIPQNLTKLLRILMRFLFREYISIQLDRAVQALPITCAGAFAKTFEIIENFFGTIFVANHIVVFTQKLFYVHIAPRLSTSANEFTSCENEKNKQLAKLEEKIEEGIRKSLSALISAIEIILSNQSKKDFKLKNEARTQSIDGVTKTCTNCINFIFQVKAMFEKNMDGRNVDSTIAEFGNRIYSTLLNHFKKFKISQGLGGLQLLQDLTAY